MLEDFGGGASVEYFRKDERKEALGTRAEAKGTRRTEDLKEEVRVFMVVWEETWSTDDISASLLAQMITKIHLTIRHLA